MKSKVLRWISVLALTAVVLTVAPTTGYAAKKTTKQMAKERYAEYLKTSYAQKFAVVDVTGDKIPELLCDFSGAIGICTYDKENDRVVGVIVIMGSGSSDDLEVRYDASQRVVGVWEKEGEPWGGSTLTQYFIVRLTKNCDYKGDDGASESYSYGDVTSRDSNFKSVRKKYKALKSKVKFVKNISENRKKLKE